MIGLIGKPGINRKRSHVNSRFEPGIALRVFGLRRINIGNADSLAVQNNRVAVDDGDVLRCGGSCQK